MGMLIINKLYELEMVSTRIITSMIIMISVAINRGSVNNDTTVMTMMMITIMTQA